MDDGCPEEALLEGFQALVGRGGNSRPLWLWSLDVVFVFVCHGGSSARIRSGKLGNRRRSIVDRYDRSRNLSCLTQCKLRKSTAEPRAAGGVRLSGLVQAPRHVCILVRPESFMIGSSNKATLTESVSTLAGRPESSYTRCPRMNHQVDLEYYISYPSFMIPVKGHPNF